MSAKTITVAVVDDHTIMRSELSKHIELMGFNVVVQAENGKKAIDKINEAPQKPSVCLLDLNMPVMDGIAAARQLSKLYPNMRILGNSVNNDTASIISFLQNGACGYVVKGCAFEELRKAIETSFYEGYYMNGNVAHTIFKFLRVGAVVK